MAAIGNATLDVQLTGSAVRLRALELSIQTTKDITVEGRPARPDFIIGRAKLFEKYITGE